MMNALKTENEKSVIDTLISSDLSVIWNIVNVNMY